MAQVVPPATFKKVFQSSHIHSALYTPSTQSLQITFTNGRVYVSDPDVPVPADVWGEFTRTGSPGQFFDRAIKPYWGGQELILGAKTSGSVQKQGTFDPSGPVDPTSI